jgi:hypothetical protein
MVKNAQAAELDHDKGRENRCGAADGRHAGQKLEKPGRRLEEHNYQSAPPFSVRN